MHIGVKWRIDIIKNVIASYEAISAHTDNIMLALYSLEIASSFLLAIMFLIK